MNLTNHFLLALPALHQDYFAASLTYICEHSSDGAMGIVVNRPCDISVLEPVSCTHLTLPTIAGV